jgi:hypothetical protein
MTRNPIIIIAVLLVTLYHVSAQDPVVASQPLLGGGFYNITVTGSSGALVVKIISVDENGVVLFQAAYNDAVEYYDGHMTALITREGFSLHYDNAFGCYRRCASTSLTRESPPLLRTYQYATCGGHCF